MVIVLSLSSSPQSSSDPDCILIQRHCGTWWKGEKVSSSIFPLLDLISFSFSFIFNLSWIRKFLSAWQQWLVCLAKELFRHFWVMIDSAIYAERGYWPIAMHRISIFDQNADQRVKTLLIWEFINVGFNNVEVLEGINVDERVLGLLPNSNYVNQHITRIWSILQKLFSGSFVRKYHRSHPPKMI